MRYNDIDIAKGIGILMVMGLHCGFHQLWMASFEMPLFFILSGCFFNVSITIKQFVIKKINTLLIPYLFFESPKILYDLGFYIFHDNKSFLNCYFDSALPTTTWFLLCLFEIQLLSYFIIKIINKPLYLLAIGLGLSILGYFLWYFSIPNVLYLCSAVTCSFYFFLGYILRRIIFTSPKHSYCNKSYKISPYQYYYIIIGLSLLALCYTIWNINKPDVFYRGNMMTDMYIYIILMAICGSTGVILISKAIIHSNTLEFFGKNSLIILGTHLYFFLLLNHINIHVQPYIVFSYGIIIEIPIIYILRQYFPKLCGIAPLIMYKK